jgi:nitrate reductase assembly molybdenum cofactor insertion protein NarJ
MTNKKDPDELRERIKDIVHKTYKHNDTTELLEDIAADELLALISTEQDKARIDELERTVNASDEKKWQQDYTRVFEISLYREWRLKELERRLGDETLKFKQ